MNKRRSAFLITAMLVAFSVGAKADIAKDDDLPDDVKELEKKLGNSAKTLAPNLSEIDPGSKLEPSEQFYRVPLRPRITDESWIKWAGPALEKSSKIRRGDTLWGTSDRLFGNPYLWPKVWQLNANVSNPHELAIGMKLMFTPGNPNAAPTLAFKNGPEISTDDLPIMASTQLLSDMELIEKVLEDQYASPDPPFKYFLFNTKPKSEGKILKPDEPERVLYVDGMRFKTKAQDGEYSVIRVQDADSKLGSAYKLRWVGTVKVKNKEGTVEKAFSEMEVGDLLVTRNFSISPLAIHEEKMGDAKSALVPIEEGMENVVAEHRLVGVRFKSVEVGPRAGALMQVMRNHEKIATLLLVDRNEKVGTFWVVNNKQEIDFAQDHVE